jgi:pyruvate/2-oxoglutarate dehydrogenase complex dihydrolipoamide acyltransferase (E2) component
VSVHEVRLPQLGLVMEGAKLLAVLKRVGERVEKGEPLLEIETEKAQVTVDAPASGYLRAVVAEVGQSYPVGTVLAYVTDAPDEPFSGSG